MKLHSLLSHLPLLSPVSVDNPDITSVENDHRLIKEGSLFICVKGYTVDSHDFASLAVERGAKAIIAERELDVKIPVIVVPNTTKAMAILADAFHGHPTQQLNLIGITGTNGKTTTSHLIEKILRDAGSKTGLIGTMYTKIGDEKQETKNTTPDSLTLQKVFKQMTGRGVTHAVMEVSSHALELGRVNGCDFDIAIFTNLTQDHLDFHGTMENYKFAKGLLFSRLGNSYSEAKPKFAVLNADDPASADFMKYTAAHVLTYGIDEAADVMAKNVAISSSGTRFTLTALGESTEVKLKMAGKFSVYNTLAAIAAGLCAGLDIPSMLTSLEAVKGVSGRFELVDEGQDFAVIVDYAHTPDSLENVIRTVKEFAEQRVFVVVGCGGDRDKTKRPLMAQIACELATNPIFTADNPRSEDPLEIIKDMEEGVKGLDYTVIPDRKQAIEHAISEAKSGDVIIIAGKGHETYQIVGDKIHDFDDRLVAREFLVTK
ncbi:UDP-N-acetylmuramoyl-L-alanyl-D-glutamate--2,6-diaminopimelate ligase [Peribacillus deserti]|uniref:UDP-N-acetylmuramoyl-L-alanyl-D-glutamate--2,6-diaminopimelate ligase n=1 Tax=Peribacillus deserti TaxID=673318 RepID=A0ABS2QHC9_9BACI|nr:UDP-N-acetylmuramoyl-L-alanyl-D-glutamate--2,6-diaminopimelate ligase [Peribacillus deserti]MBM7692365.1 UDP-N-acetylmuramoyl-L-alanyl-D-glutamate--2,6-diaminopimelate ligase [Peribacillus deserti]